MHTGTRLRQLRQEKGITQKELSEAIHLSPQAVSYVEQKGSMTTPTLEALADYFGCSTDYILCREPRQGALLTAEEMMLVEQYRRADDYQKRILRAVLQKG